MGYRILVSTTPEERRVAIVEGGELKEYYREWRYDRGPAGNIYKGKVVRVMPGINAAFVEIGLGRAAFLEIDERRLYQSKDETVVLEEKSPDAYELKPLDDILVQVKRAPLHNKGARVTREISLASRYVTFLPNTPIIACSRRIQDEEERARLKKAIEGILPEGTGVVIRTAARLATEEDIRYDLTFLVSVWQRIKEIASSMEAPALVHEDLDLLLRVARDMLTDVCEAMVVDTEEDYDRLLQFVDTFMPDLAKRISFYRYPTPLFEYAGLERSISRLFEPVVGLRSGGSIVVQKTEALWTVDVNSGRFLGYVDPEETALITNLEAAKEICSQIRLRNIGGTIVIDFICLKDPENMQKVMETLANELQHDREECEVSQMSPSGLVEIRRKRARNDMFEESTETCPYCRGRGFTKSARVIASEVVSALKVELQDPRCKTVKVVANPKVIEALVVDFTASLSDMEKTTRKSVRLTRDSSLHLEHFHLVKE